MTIDFAIVTYDRVTIPENQKDRVLAALKSGLIKNTDDLNECVEDPTILSWDTCFGGEYQLSVEQNEGHPTIEAMEDDKVIYTNSK